ncbi:MAG: hypothetical protein ACLSA6_11365 [Holdemania massiliensis]
MRLVSETGEWEAIIGDAHNKRGFVSLFFLSWFLIISAWVSLGYLQLGRKWMSRSSCN